MMEKPSKYATFAEFWPAFVPALTGMIGFWATLSLNIPDFTRYGRGQRDQMIGQTLGLPTTMIAFSMMGVMITSASQTIFTDPAVQQKLWDPVFLLSQMTSAEAPYGLPSPLIASGAARAGIAVISLLGVAIATISVNIAANVVSPANDFANLAPRHISFKTGGLITGVFGILMMPWKLLASAGDYIFTWLIGYSALLGPIAGIMVVDYWIVRKQNLDIHDLYRPAGRYSGTNPVAVIALIAGILPNLPGFLKVAGIAPGVPDIFATIYTYAWFIGFALSGAIYGAGMMRQRR